MKLCICGEEVEDYVRFHWTSDNVGHYADAEEAEASTSVPGGLVIPESWTPNLVRCASAGLWGQPPPWSAPPPGEIPEKPWPKEEELRWGGTSWMKDFGFAVYDLEQSYRADGSTRVTEGIGDTYFHGHGIRGWIEWKRWDNEPTEKQRAFGLEELAQGGIYLLVYETAQLVKWNQLRRRS